MEIIHLRIIDRIDLHIYKKRQRQGCVIFNLRIDCDTPVSINLKPWLDQLTLQILLEGVNFNTRMRVKNLYRLFVAKHKGVVEYSTEKELTRFWFALPRVQNRTFK